MDKGYIHVEIESSQISKKPGQPCGDVLAFERTASATTLVVSDGKGHGIKAHIAAQLCVSRILELMRQGFSMRKAFSTLVNTMNKARETDLPYAVFTVVRILNDGVTTVLSYEMPAPLFVTTRYSQVLPQRSVTIDNAIIGEANCHVAPNEGIVVVSDGITQSGLGMGLTNGWTIEGTSQYISDCLADGIKLKDIPKTTLIQAKENWKVTLGDDCTVVLAACRLGKTVNILTGPPCDPKKDKEVVNRFMMMDGIKVVSGGTTAKIIADCLGKEVMLEENPQSMLAPARYMIDGIDLVTEGAITLNQVYNVLDEDPSSFDEESGVTQLQELLLTADRINLIVGSAINPATRDISFRQKGILTRQAIIPLISKKLQSAGKLVVIEVV